LKQKFSKLLVVLVGPTASGKTAVGIELAKKINAEIISADSRQIYKYLDIGTAKPTRAKTQKRKNAKTPIIIKGVPHYLIDIIEPDKTYSAGEFRRDAEKIIEKIYARKKTPLVVGGTGLYIRALVDGLSELPSADINLRKKFIQQAKKYGKDYLYKKLQKVDLESAKKIHPQNLPRIIRALEVYHLTKIPLSAWHKKTPFPKYKVKIFGLSWERDKLYQRINERVDKMREGGILDELKRVMKRSYSKDSPGFQGLGYKHLLKFLNGNHTLEETINLWKRDTRRYAKRQMTWFKKDKRINWIEINQPLNQKIIAEKIEKFLKKD